MTLYTVSWARAIGGDGVPVDAFSGCAGAFTDSKRAEVCLQKEVDALLAELHNTDDLDDRMLFEQSLRITGDVSEWSVEVDYSTPDDTDMEWYFTINEVELEED